MWVVMITVRCPPAIGRRHRTTRSSWSSVARSGWPEQQARQPAGVLEWLRVTFVSGTFVLTDTLQRLQLAVQSRLSERRLRGPIHSCLLQRRGPGCDPQTDFPVDCHEGSTDSRGGRCRRNRDRLCTVRRPEREGNGQRGCSTLGMSYDPNARLSPLHLTLGTAPNSSNEIVMDVATAQKYHFAVGDHVRVLLTGSPRTFTISGIARYGSTDDLAGATIAAFVCPRPRGMWETWVATTPSTS